MEIKIILAWQHSKSPQNEAFNIAEAPGNAASAFPGASLGEDKYLPYLLLTILLWPRAKSLCIEKGKKIYFLGKVLYTSFKVMHGACFGRFQSCFPADLPIRQRGCARQYNAWTKKINKRW